MILTENPYPYNPKPTPNLSNTAYNAFNAGAKAQLKKIYDWGYEPCPHFYNSATGLQGMKRECEKCWQALLGVIDRGSFAKYVE